MRQSFLCMCSILALAAAAGCTTNVSGGEAAPKMSFNYVEPLTLNVGSKVIDDRHMPAANDASDDLPTPPSLALRRYAENRLKSLGGTDTLYFVIEEANVTKVIEKPDGKVMQWVGVNDSDKYSMSVVVRLYMQDANGSQSNHSLLNFNRSVTIPHHYSLAEKELEKLKFMENFMKDVDDAVENTVRTRGWIANGYNTTPVQL